MERQTAGWFSLLCLVTSNCLAQPYFFRKDIPVGQSPMEVFVGDFNGDRKPDLAVYTWATGFSILFNTGGGSFGRPVKAEIGTSFPQRLVVADVNGDGKDDLVTGQPQSAGVFVSRGDGTFQRTQQLSAVAAGDFNSDGKTDILISDPGKDVQVLLGNGDGTFRAGATLAAKDVRWVVVADLNRDGRGDVVCLLQPNPLTMSLGGYLAFLGKGDGTFGAAMEVPAVVGDPQLIFYESFYLADFNGDGNPDLALPNGILLGKGDGSFQAPLIRYPWSVTSPIQPLVYAVADLTGDRKPDLVTGLASTTHLVSVYPGKGDGTFASPIDLVTGWGSGTPVWSPLAAADFDGDGRLDIVAANGTSNTLSLLAAKAQGGPSLRRAVSTASGTAIVAPRSLATLLTPTPVTGDFSAPQPDPGRPAVEFELPTSLGGIRLNVRDSAGVTRQAPLLFVSAQQVDFQVPAGTALGEASLAIVDSRGTTEAGSMQVDAAAPGVFTLFPGSSIPAATAMLAEAEGTLIPLPVYTCAPTPRGISCDLAPIPLHLTGEGSIYVIFYGTGFSGVSLSNVVITENITGTRLPVLYAGPQAIQGLDQINVRLTPEVRNEFGFLELSIRIDGVEANSVLLGAR